MFGYESAEDLYDSVDDISSLVFADPARRVDLVRTLLANRGSVTSENLYRRKDGSTFVGTLRMRAVLGEDNQVLFFEGIVDDITDRSAPRTPCARPTPGCRPSSIWPRPGSR